MKKITIILLVLFFLVIFLLGFFLVQRIGPGPLLIKVIDLTDEQLTYEISKIFYGPQEFSEEGRSPSIEKGLIIYPPNRLVNIKLEERGGIAIGIMNLIYGEKGLERLFSYEIHSPYPEKVETMCGVENEIVESWIESELKEENISINPGEIFVKRIIFNVPERSLLCVVRFRVDIYVDNEPYATDYFDIQTRT